MKPKLPKVIFLASFLFLLVGISLPFLFPVPERPDPFDGAQGKLASVVLAANSGDVVINEIAWMGTEASSSDEWVEFYNNTDAPVDIGDWSIYGADTGVCLNFSGADGSVATTVPDKGYLIYANHADDVRDDRGVSIVGVWDATIGMNNTSPGQMILYDAPDCEGNVVDIANQTEGDWFAGTSKPKLTMERIDPEASGSAKLNWATNDGKTTNGKDAGGSTIMGTPKAQNSVYGKPPEDGEPEEGIEIVFTVPTEVTAGESFKVEVSAKNFEASSDYWFKFLAAPRSGRFYDGRTLGADGETYLAWNASWEKMPKFTTDAAGAASFTLQAMIDEDASAGDYEAKIRVRKVGDDENIDSEVKSLKVEESQSDSSDDEVFEGEISEIKDLELGTKVKVQGFVTAPPGIFGDDIFYIRDDSAGIKVSNDDLSDHDLQLGDEVELSCTIEESRDERYIKLDDDSSLVVVRSDLSGPGPVEVETGAINEGLEGQLVKLSGEIVETSGGTFWIDDGSGRAKIYVKDSTGIEIPAKRVGYEAEVVGIVSQWGELKDGSPNYRVMPRFQSDLEITKPEGDLPSVALAKEGDVLGGAIGLPITSSPQNLLALLGGVYLCLGLAVRLVVISTRSKSCLQASLRLQFGTIYCS